MVIETVFIAFRRRHWGSHRESLRVASGTFLYGRYLKAGRFEPTRGNDDSHPPHPRIDPTTRNDKSLAFCGRSSSLDAQLPVGLCADRFWRRHDGRHWLYKKI